MCRRRGCVDALAEALKNALTSKQEAEHEAGGFRVRDANGVEKNECSCGGAVSNAGMTRLRMMYWAPDECMEYSGMIV